MAKYATESARACLMLRALPEGISGNINVVYYSFIMESICWYSGVHNGTWICYDAHGFDSKGFYGRGDYMAVKTLHWLSENGLVNWIEPNDDRVLDYYSLHAPGIKQKDWEQIYDANCKLPKTEYDSIWHRISLLDWADIRVLSYFIEAYHTRTCEKVSMLCRHTGTLWGGVLSDCDARRWRSIQKLAGQIVRRSYHWRNIE